MVSGLFEMVRKGSAQSETTDNIRLKHNILFNPRTGFFEYQEPLSWATEKGIWKQVDDKVILGYVKNALGRFANGSNIHSILKLIKVD